MYTTLIKGYTRPLWGYTRPLWGYPSSPNIYKKSSTVLGYKIVHDSVHSNLQSNMSVAIVTAVLANWGIFSNKHLMY